MMAATALLLLAAGPTDFGMRTAPGAHPRPLAGSPALGQKPTGSAGSLSCIAPAVIDGDGIRCRNLGQVRLLGIDAADYRDSRPCQGGYGDHVCDSRAAAAAKASLRAALRLGPVRVQPVGRDRYGRVLGIVTAGGVNLNCRQLASGGARYIGRYDEGGRIARACDRPVRAAQ